MLIVLGIVVGIMSGFFGIGGGFALVPMLILIGFDIKTAIGISVLQMVFSSIFGSYLNYKKGSLKFDSSAYVGVGGAIGALMSGYIVTVLSATTLKALFIFLVAFAIAQMLRPVKSSVEKQVHPLYLVLVGALTGAFAISLGVGGSVLIVPILAGFLYYPIKKAVSAGLFFVVFSSISGLISMSYYGHIDYVSGSIVGVSALVGVAIGIWLKDVVSDKQHKRYILILYSVILVYMTYEFIKRTFA
jgi:hypothetical protein